MVNLELPLDVRQDMRYPNLPTTLATDPTEAIHAELIFAVLRRYFREEYFKYLGGAIGYLLTHNERLHSRPEAEVAPYVVQILREDRKLTESRPETSLFAYWIGAARPRPLHRLS